MPLPLPDSRPAPAARPPRPRPETTRGARKPSVLNRRLHRWGAIAAAVPVAVVIATGLLLQLKKHVAWVQPPEQRGSATVPGVSMDQLLAAARSVPQAAVRDWSDVDRVDVRPSKGLAKISTTNRWEVQIDIATGQVLQSAYRRSDLLEALHDGSWFHEHAKLWLFFPAGLVLLALWLTGLYLWWLPVGVRRRRRAAAAAEG